MIVAAHQPNFLPWLGYFHKMARADVFVFLDDVQMPDRGYVNRVKIKTATGAQWLTVPVKDSCKRALIKDVTIGDVPGWRRKVIRTLFLNYGESKYLDAIGEILLTEWVALDCMNIGLILHVMQALGISWPAFGCSSDLGTPDDPTERLVAICKEVGGDVYLSGPSGRDYLNESAFEREGIRVEYTDFKHPVYPQRFGEFVPGLSAVDLLCNCGKKSRKILLGGSR